MSSQLPRSNGLFHLAERSETRMPFDTPNLPGAMSEIVVVFVDTTRDSNGARGGAKPARGMPDHWLDALIGDGHIEERQYVTPGVLSRVHARFPTKHHCDQFACAVRQVSKLVGTWALIRNPSS